MEYFNYTLREGNVYSIGETRDDLIIFKSVAIVPPAKKYVMTSSKCERGFLDLHIHELRISLIDAQWPVGGELPATLDVYPPHDTAKIDFMKLADTKFLRATLRHWQVEQSDCVRHVCYSAACRKL